jgi:hypothetical protein
MATIVSDIRRTKEGVYIGRPRSGQPWGFGNPFIKGRDGSLSTLTAKMEHWLNTGDAQGSPDATLERRQWILDHAYELRDQTLLCWCNGASYCHGHMLARLAAR